MEKKFIKVTPKGAKQSVIVPAVNEAFYRSQNAKIETPTDEEVEAVRPELKMQREALKAAKSVAAELAALRKENKALKAENEALKAAKSSGKGK